MMTNKTSKSSHLLKLLALLPIVGITLALNAETVKNYVYDEPQKQVPVKKGKTDATVKVGDETIKVVGDTFNIRIDNPGGMEFFQTEPDKRPLYLVNGLRVNRDMVEKIAPKDIASVSVLKNKAAIEMYGEEAKDGVVIITLKDDIDEKDGETFDVVEEMPQFPGGMYELMQYLGQNIRYPKDAVDANTQGRVLVSFVVKKDGSISDAKVVKSVAPSLDDEALRVVSAMPAWTPGKQNGKPVNVKYTIPVNFRLEQSAEHKEQ